MILRVFALGVALLLMTSTAAAQEPIRVGFITDLTGPLAQPGKEMENGIRLFLAEHKNTLSGRPVELTVLDGGSSPAVALTKARELVEQRKVHVIIGPLPAFEAYAIVPYLNEKRIPSLSPSAAADDLTQRKATQFFVRVASTSSQPTQPFGTYAAKTLGYKKVATIADDFAFGHEVVAGFHKAFEDAGGQIVQKLWPPLGTKDQGPFIARLRKDIDAVFIGFAGVAALRFLKQFEEAGLKGKIAVLANQTAVDEALLRSMGDEALGVISTMHYSAALETPANRKFVAAYRKGFGTDPGYYSVGAYTAGLFLKQALEQVGGKVENTDNFLKALRSVAIADAPGGPIRLDKYGQAVHNIYIRRVEKRDGRLQNTVIHTIENGSQFWTYPEAEFLKQPVYSRDYPPCRFC
ncbi:MAG: ABC transporter substrate-binding protein [Candidatus Rokubacteria bacterium]|nr:ABC transporter substrate-binding protein [Candidatus Rokubacteria bacterium]